jgi:putative membrane protein
VKAVLLLFALLIIISCVLILVRGWTPRARALAAPDKPKEILKRRYAAGEIDEEEYLRRMSGLSQDW